MLGISASGMRLSNNGSFDLCHPISDPIAKRSAYFEDVSASFAIAHGGPKLSARYAGQK